MFPSSPWFSTAVYLLCFATSATCAVMLFRAYVRAGAQMLWWSALCFALLAVTNLLVIVDLVIVPGPALDLRIARNAVSLLAVGVLLFGFIWRGEEQ